MHACARAAARGTSVLTASASTTTWAVSRGRERVPTVDTTIGCMSTTLSGGTSGALAGEAVFPPVAAALRTCAQRELAVHERRLARTCSVYEACEASPDSKAKLQQRQISRINYPGQSITSLPSGSVQCSAAA